MNSITITDKTTDKVSTTTQQRYSGRVKWFNNGYGFITMYDNNNVRVDNIEKEENIEKELEEKDTKEKDVFVHHTSIHVETNQYKYLVQGEYVEFNILPVDKEGARYDFQATNVTGINGGKLLCETRREFQLEQSKYKQTEKGEEGQTNTRTYQYRGSGRGYTSFSGRGRGRGRGYVKV